MARLRDRQRYDSPVREASGLCVTSLGGREHLVTVGDWDTTLAWCPLDPAPGEWTSLDLGTLAGAPADLGQFEAVEDAGGGRVLVLCEEPSLVVLVDVAGQQLEASWRIVAGEDRAFAKLWNRDVNSRGEAMVVGPEGHLLIVKEKDPVVIVEVGPSGADPVMAGPWRAAKRWRGPADGELVPLAWGELVGGPRDVSDAAVLSDRLFLLSDQDACLVECRPSGSSWAAGDSSPLDKSIDKPEGVAVTGDGRLFVAMDVRNEQGAIVELDPPA